MKSGKSDLVAECYRLSKPLTSDYDDVRYYTALLSGSGDRVLDVATGTGRFLLALRGVGVEADGLDHSSAMLDVCGATARERGFSPRLYCGDMESFEVDTPYDVVILPAGAIKEIDGYEATLSCLRQCYQSLTPHGRIVVDLVPLGLVSGSASRAQPFVPAAPQVYREGDVTYVQETLSIEFDPVKNRVQKALRYQRWSRGELTATEVHDFCIQFWSLREFRVMLQLVGFEKVSVTGGYRAGSHPLPGDDDWTFSAVKP